MGITVRDVVEADWRQLRDLRIQALADSPHAFVETLLHATTQTDDDWRARARWPEQGTRIAVVALDGPGFVGTMRCELEPTGWGQLYGVFVTPSHRGPRLRVADAMLDRVEEWAATVGAVGLELTVHERNLRAQRFYLRRGYAFTGEREPYELDPTADELHMARALAGAT